MKIYERFLKYVSYPTMSCSDSETVPSTAKQKILGADIAAELRSLGLADAHMDELGYVYATLPANTDKEVNTIGFIAHMDTAPDFSGEGVNPVIHENYDGGAIALGDTGRVLDPKVFPHLESLKGRTLITTDGKTLLGADDKAGVSEIMTLVEELMKSNTPHGEVLIGFTPDEEIGEGADFFDVERFGAEFAYTVDGGEEGSLEYENFNAASAKVEIQGRNVHPGYAKNKMINAIEVAGEFMQLLPTWERPEHTEGYEGIYSCKQNCANEYI